MLWETRHEAILGFISLVMSHLVFGWLVMAFLPSRSWKRTNVSRSLSKPKITLLHVAKWIFRYKPLYRPLLGRKPEKFDIPRHVIRYHVFLSGLIVCPGLKSGVTSLSKSSSDTVHFLTLNSSLCFKLSCVKRLQDRQAPYVNKIPGSASKQLPD